MGEDEAGEGEAVTSEDGGGLGAVSCCDFCGGGLGLNILGGAAVGEAREGAVPVGEMGVVAAGIVVGAPVGDVEGGEATVAALSSGVVGAGGIITDVGRNGRGAGAGIFLTTGAPTGAGDDKVDGDDVDGGGDDAGLCGSSELELLCGGFGRRAPKGLRT
jgi:hypothetical protein